MVRGLQAAGVAATVKHAPGIGHISTDTHHGLAVVEAGRDTLEAREFVPFRAAFGAGARLAMSGHAAVPAVSGRDDLPATLSRTVMTDLLRGDLGFEGVTISDALDMGALAQGPAQVLDVIAAVRAGVDLLLAAADPVALARIEDTLVRAVALDLLDPAEVAATERRVAALRAWLGSAGPAPDLAVVGCAEHRALAAELAAGSITLVRDPGGLLPLLGRGGAVGSGRSPGHGSNDQHRRGTLLAVMPRPADLTPADTSSSVAPGLAAALGRYHPDVEEIVVDPSPDRDSIAAVRDRAAQARVVVVGTIDAHRQPAQLELVEAIAATGTPVIAVALRAPWDVAAYPPTVTALATYSILPASVAALAAVLAGDSEAPGRLPVSVPAGAMPVPA
jgi:beta-N-acetylhexosaminidase